jgi:hypothetical protein
MQAELAPADPAVAAAYLIDQNPHPLPWEAGPLPHARRSARPRARDRARRC